MSNTYRIVHTEPYKLIIQMATVSGWIDADIATSVAEAKDKIKARKEKEDWIVKIYDEAGDVVETRPASNQPVVNA